MMKRKAFAYITHGERLLVFSHPLAPDAGIQVPAGTMRDDERREDAVMREASEETGLTDLVLVRFLGERVRNMADFGHDEMHHRYFYHLRCTSEPPDMWRNHEPDPADGGELPDEIPELIADHDALLSSLIGHLSAAIRTDSSGSRPLTEW